MPTAKEVFDAGEYSQYSYVKRDSRRIDSRLERVLRSSTPGASIVGPSKSGKTALVKNTARETGIPVIQVRGPEIGSVDELWNIVLDELDAPETVDEHRSDTTESGSTTTGGIKPQGTGIDHARQKRDAETTGQSRSFSRRGLRQVIDYAESRNFIILIDDFHYIDSKETKKSIVQSLKGAIEDKVPVCVAFVTHRGETLQQLVSDIDDRIMTIPVQSWTTSELKEIVNEGQQHLNIEFSEELKDGLAKNAVKSPMIMQRLCASACEVAGITGTRDPNTEPEVIDLSDDEFERVLTIASDWMGKRSVVRQMLGGVNDSGRETYDYGGEEEVDTYVLTLRAIANGDATNSFHFSDLKKRIREDCVDRVPRGTQISNVCDQMESIADENRPGEELIEWDSDERVLMITDPELLFLIRHIMKDEDYDKRMLGM
ncbi:ATP-binding protein [Halomicrobium katesii]|uniref:ATP-binding protein n=1 Tax=Halomicrobium katesii TaxID=437163 RepID=UPI0009B5CF4B|nr:ATP-binding protein [Halomicrobium katesii]